MQIMCQSKTKGDVKIFIEILLEWIELHWCVWLMCRKWPIKTGIIHYFSSSNFYSAMTSIPVMPDRLPVKSCDGRIVSASSKWWTVWSIRAMSKDTEHYSITQCTLFPLFHNPHSDWMTLFFVSDKKHKVLGKNCKDKQEQLREKERGWRI